MPYRLGNTLGVRNVPPLCRTAQLLYRTGGAGHGYLRLPAGRRVEPEHRRLRLVGAALAGADHRAGGPAFLSQLSRVSVPQLVVRDSAPVAHLERGSCLKNTVQNDVRSTVDGPGVGGADRVPWGGAKDKGERTLRCGCEKRTAVTQNTKYRKTRLSIRRTFRQQSYRRGKANLLWVFRFSVCTNDRPRTPRQNVYAQTNASRR